MSYQVGDHVTVLNRFGQGTPLADGVVVAVDSSSADVRHNGPYEPIRGWNWKLEDLAPVQHTPNYDVWFSVFSLYRELDNLVLFGTAPSLRWGLEYLLLGPVADCEIAVHQVAHVHR